MSMLVEVEESNNRLQMQKKCRVSGHITKGSPNPRANFVVRMIPRLSRVTPSVAPIDTDYNW